MSSKRVWRWALFGTVGAILVLTIATPIAARAGIKSDWYAGYGQWLGAIGALVAAAVALGIATTDRRIAAEQRDAENTERDATLKREAALVRVGWEQVTTMRTFGGDRTEPMITVTNRRDVPIFDIEVVSFAQDGQEPDTRFEVTGYMPLPMPDDANFAHQQPIPSHLVVEPAESIAFSIGTASDSPALVAVTYTDQKGYRWRVDSRGEASQIVHGT
ncbi:hypothetical protein TSOC111612_11375 [Tsukamurella ocularis]|uniref:hypothetical protein n=1 Tax=Tsukamurella ocularis TaxID=1970234 RepID=UPI0039EF8531